MGRLLLYWRLKMGITEDQLKMAYKLHRVARFQTHHMLEPMSVSEHSFRVVSLYIYLGGTEIIAALYHDLEESLTGDLPGPIKGELTGLEKFEALKPQFVDPQEKLLCKLADKLDLLIHIRPQITYSDTMLDIYETELELAKEVAKKIGKIKEVNKILKLLKD